MKIYYRSVVTTTVEPSVKNLGDIWIRPLSSVTYQSYIYINGWKEFVGGGGFITESNSDTYYINVVVNETEPVGVAQLGWIWIKESIAQAYLCLGGIYVPVAS
jgi:hypothetical protein